MRPIKIVVAVCLITGMLYGCGKKIDLQVYSEFNRFKDAAFPIQPENVKPPVIFIPGIEGSRLADDEEVHWGTVEDEALISFFDDLALDMNSQSFKDDQDPLLRTWVEEYRNKKIQEDGVLKTFSLGFFRNAKGLTFPVYDDIGKHLSDVSGYSEDNDLFLMPYDWRLDNRVAAVKLGLLLDAWEKKYRSYIGKLACGSEEKSKCDNYTAALKSLADRGYVTANGKIRFNIVAHSMGGLVSRYYLQALDRDGRIHKLIVLGTPNRGAMKMLENLANGMDPNSFAWYEKSENKPVIFSFPSVYQLLPRYGSLFLTTAGTSTLLDSYRAEKELALASRMLPVSAADSAFESAVKSWYRYSLVPCETLVERKYATCSPLKNKEALNKTLRANLESAYKFHLALNDPAHGDGNYECGRLKAAEVFLRNTNKQSADFSPELITRNCNGADIAREDRSTRERLIIFGGFGDETLTHARVAVSPEDPEKYLLDFDTECDACLGLLTPGDGTVPLKSIKYAQTYVKDNSNFYMSETHMALVKNKTFVYNVMRQLLDLE